MSTRNGKRSRATLRQRGVALVAVLLSLLLITLLGLALTAMAMLSVTISTNDREASEAFYIADAGVAHARRLILLQPPAGPDFDSFLRAGNGVACDGDELSVAPAPPLLPGDSIRSVTAGGHPFGPIGRYEVTVCDDHAAETSAAPNPPNLPDNDPNNDANGTILVRSVGSGRNDATATIEIVVSVIPLPGLLVNGNLRINGNPALTGAGGAAHANGILEVSGVPCAEDYFSATGTVSGSGGARTNAETGTSCGNNPPRGSDPVPDLRPGAPRIPIPPINPADFRGQADFILGADGVIRDQAGTDVTRANPDWSWDPGNRRWVAGNNIGAGTYYAEGNIEISGNPGAGGPPGRPPLALSLIAEGWINISGNPSVQPDLIVGARAISMVAGTDLRISGNPATNYQGLHFAKHQIDFSGNPTINGQVIAENEGDFGTPQNLVVLQQGGFMGVSGNPTLNYTGTGGFSGIGVTGWRECRGMNPANPCQ